MVMQMALAIKCLSGLVSQWGCEPGGDRERQLGPSPWGGRKWVPSLWGGRNRPCKGERKRRKRIERAGMKLLCNYNLIIGQGPRTRVLLSTSDFRGKYN